MLFLSQSLPYHHNSGVTIARLILRECARVRRTLVAFSRRIISFADDRSFASTALRREVSEVFEPTPINAEWSLTEKLRVHAASVLTRKPYTFYEYGDPRFGHGIESAINDTPPDLVHLDGMDLYRWLTLLPAVPTACTHHSVESDLLRLRVNTFGARGAPISCLSAPWKRRRNLCVGSHQCQTSETTQIVCATCANRLTMQCPTAGNRFFCRPAP